MARSTCPSITNSYARPPLATSASKITPSATTPVNGGRSPLAPREPTAPSMSTFSCVAITSEHAPCRRVDLAVRLLPGSQRLARLEWLRCHSQTNIGRADRVEDGIAPSRQMAPRPGRAGRGRRPARGIREGEAVALRGDMPGSRRAGRRPKRKATRRRAPTRWRTRVARHPARRRRIGRVSGRRRRRRSQARRSAAAAATRVGVVMVGNLRGARMARRCRVRWIWSATESSTRSETSSGPLASQAAAIRSKSRSGVMPGAPSMVGVRASASSAARSVSVA